MKERGKREEVKEKRCERDERKMKRSNNEKWKSVTVVFFAVHFFEFITSLIFFCTVCTYRNCFEVINIYNCNLCGRHCCIFQLSKNILETAMILVPFVLWDVRKSGLVGRLQSFNKAASRTQAFSSWALQGFTGPREEERKLCASVEDLCSSVDGQPSASSFSLHWPMPVFFFRRW